MKVVTGRLDAVRDQNNILDACYGHSSVILNGNFSIKSPCQLPSNTHLEGDNAIVNVGFSQRRWNQYVDFESSAFHVGGWGNKELHDVPITKHPSFPDVEIGQSIVALADDLSVSPGFTDPGTWIMLVSADRETRSGVNGACKQGFPVRVAYFDGETCYLSGACLQSMQNVHCRVPEIVQNVTIERIQFVSLNPNAKPVTVAGASRFRMINCESYGMCAPTLSACYEFWIKDCIFRGSPNKYFDNGDQISRGIDLHAMCGDGDISGNQISEMFHSFDSMENFQYAHHRNIAVHDNLCANSRFTNITTHSPGGIDFYDNRLDGASVDSASNAQPYEHMHRGPDVTVRNERIRSFRYGEGQPSPAAIAIYGADTTVEGCDILCDGAGIQLGNTNIDRANNTVSGGTIRHVNRGRQSGQLKFRGIDAFRSARLASSTIRDFDVGVRNIGGESVMESGLLLENVDTPTEGRVETRPDSGGSSRA